MDYTIVSGNKPSSVALHQNHAIKSIYRNALIKWQIYVQNLNMPKTKWDIWKLNKQTKSPSNLAVFFLFFLAKYIYLRTITFLYNLLSQRIKETTCYLPLYVHRRIHLCRILWCVGVNSGKYISIYVHDEATNFGKHLF